MHKTSGQTKLFNIQNIHTKFLFFLILVVTITISVFAVSLLQNNPDSNYYGKIIGHRGASGLSPENTLVSIKKAIDLNADIIEIDVHQTKDSVIVVIHDETVDRTTNGEGRVRDLTFREIKILDAGSWFNKKFKNERIPSLEEVLALIDGKCGLMIEMKGSDDIYPGIVKRVYNLINKYNGIKWCIIQSFNDEFLQSFHSIDSTIVLNKLIAFDIPFLPVFIDNSIHTGNISDYDYVDAININKIFLTQGKIENIHSAGYQVNVWTVNDSLDIEDYFRLGADGVITNFPNYKRNIVMDKNN